MVRLISFYYFLIVFFFNSFIFSITIDGKLSEQEWQDAETLNNFLTVSKNSSDNKKVGSLTKEYIEENRKVLEDQKRELRKNKL